MTTLTHEELRTALSTEGGASLLTSTIYRDPAAWLEPLAHLSRSEGGTARAEALAALATALMPAAVRNPERIPLEPVLAALSSALVDERVSLSALACVEVLGPRAASVAPALRTLLSHSDAATRYMAALALVRTGVASGEQLLPVLLTALQVELDEELLLIVYGALALLGSEASRAEPLLRQRLASATDASREAVLRALEEVAA